MGSPALDLIVIAARTFLASIWAARSLRSFSVRCVSLSFQSSSSSLGPCFVSSSSGAELLACFVVFLFLHPDVDSFIYSLRTPQLFHSPCYKSSVIYGGVHALLSQSEGPQLFFLGGKFRSEWGGQGCLPPDYYSTAIVGDVVTLSFLQRFLAESQHTQLASAGG